MRLKSGNRSIYLYYLYYHELSLIECYMPDHILALIVTKPLTTM